MLLPPSHRLPPYSAVSLPLETAASDERGGVRVLMCLAAAWLGLAFFVTDHDVRVSLDDAYTMTEDEMVMAADGGNALRQVAFLSIAAFGAFCLGKSSKQPLSVRGVLPLLLAALTAWCAASIFWSLDSSMTLRRVGVLLCLVLGAAGLGRQLTARELCLTALIVTSSFLAVGVGAELALGTFRPWAGDYRFSGSLHPNTQGMCLAVLCLSSFLLLRNSTSHRWLYTGLFAVGFLFLMLTKSRTSCAGLLLALAVVWSLNVSAGMNLLGWLGGAWIVGTAALIVLLFGIDLEEAVDRVVLMGRKQQAESLTGRLPIWTELSYYVRQRPLTGYGYDSFFTADRIDEISEKQQWAIREAHSAYIESVLTVGLVGAGLLLAAVIAGMRRAAQQFLSTRDPGYALILGLLAFGLLNAATESGMIMPLFVPFFAGCGLAHLALVHPEPAT